MIPQQPAIAILRCERDLLVQLVNLIQQAQLSLLAQDFRLFASNIEQQSHLCAQLLNLEMEGANFPSNEGIHKQSSRIRFDSKSLVPDDDFRVIDDFRSLEEEIQRFRAHVRHANLVQAALLRRAGRRARAISNLIAGKTTTYANPLFANQSVRGQ